MVSAHGIGAASAAARTGGGGQDTGRPARRAEAGARRARRDDGRRLPRRDERGRLPRAGPRRGGARARPAGASGLRGDERPRNGRHDLPRPDRAAQPPELQRAAAVERAEALRPPRPVAESSGLPQAHQRPDDGDRRAEERRRHLAAPASADPLRRVQVPAGRSDDEPGREAREQRRDPALLPRARPQRRADRRQGPARGAGPHPRHRRQGRGLVPRAAPEGGQLPAAAPRRGRDRPGPCAGLHRAAPLRRAADLADAVGARRALHRHPLRGPAARGLRRARVAPLLDRLVAVQQPAALRRHRPRRSSQGGRGHDRPRAATGRRAAARTCWASSRSPGSTTSCS